MILPRAVPLGKLENFGVGLGAITLPFTSLCREILTVSVIVASYPNTTIYLI